MCPDTTGSLPVDPTVPDPDTTYDADGLEADADLDADGAPCLICGDTVPGPRPALLCPDCDTPGRPAS
jgi:hypothetical protein